MNAKIRLKIPYKKQTNWYYCGPAALQMAFMHFGVKLDQKEIAEEINASEENGTENEDMVRFARKAGFEAVSKKHSSIQEIKEALKQNLPIIVNYIEPTDEDGHYAIVSGITPHNIVLHDPWNGKDFKLPHIKFLERWRDSQGRYERWMLVINPNKDTSMI